jgi:hypothetical protein
MTTTSKPTISSCERSDLSNNSGCSNSDSNNLKSKMKENSDGKVAHRWRVLRQQMAGVFCAALATDSVKSMPFVEPSIDSSFSKISQYYPSESVCSENIDAWVKLMPHSTRSHGKTVDNEIVDGIYRDKNGSHSIKRNSNENNDNSVVCNESHVRGLASLVRSDWLLHSPYYSLNLRAKSQKMIPNNKMNTDGSNKFDDREKHQHTNKQIFKLTLTVSITAVLLPNMLTLHTILLNKLKENTCIHLIDNTLIQESRKLPFHVNNFNKGDRTSSHSNEVYDRADSIDQSDNKNDINVGDNTEDIVDDNRGSVTSAINYNNYSDQISTDSNLAFDRVRLERDVRDSRQQHFAVHMTVKHDHSNLNRSNSEFGSIRMQVLELIPPFYKILLHTYKYTIEDDNGTSAWRYVADVPSFKFTQHDLNDESCFEGSIYAHADTGIVIPS